MSALAETEANPREQLAARIARVHLLEGDLAVNAAAQTETRAAIDAAKEAVEKARPAAEEQCHARSLADVQIVLRTTKAARVALQEAEETLEALRLHRDRLEVQAERLRADLAWARRSLENAVTQVAWPFVAELLDQYKAQHRKLIVLDATIRSVGSVIPPALYNNLQAIPSGPVEVDTRWSQWVGALHEDATVPSPRRNEKEGQKRLYR